MRILVIDDDRMILKMADFLLKKDGHEVLCAQSAQEAMQLLSQNPELIFADNAMPQMSGVELLEKLKSDESTMDIPVCMMSGTLSQELIGKVVRFGAVGCIGKPLQQTDMTRIIESIKTGG
jgi:CheY-like chemotaxis protein